ncbi:MAG: hypothetical protein AB1938_25790 [Myxococcota bacterium]
MHRVCAVAAVLLACLARADEATTVFHSEEDASTPPDATVCAQAPFATNVRLGAGLWSIETKKRNGRVVDERKRRIGRATACLELTNVLFPEGLVQRFYVRFELPQGAYVAQGTCTVSSNSVPQPFIILAGCTLKLVSGPPGTLGGLVTSASLFNPLGRPGFATGSLWTLHEYLAEGVRHECDGRDGHARGRDDD